MANRMTILNRTIKALTEKETESNREFDTYWAPMNCPNSTRPNPNYNTFTEDDRNALNEALAEREELSLATWGMTYEEHRADIVRRSTITRYENHIAELRAELEECERYLAELKNRE